jgi:hypothetical protein
MKSMRMKWAGHVVRDRSTYNFRIERRRGKTVGRPRHRWEKIINTKQYGLTHTAPKRLLNYITSYYANIVCPNKTV